MGTELGPSLPICNHLRTESPPPHVGYRLILLRESRGAGRLACSHYLRQVLCSYGESLQCHFVHSFISPPYTSFDLFKMAPPPTPLCPFVLWLSPVWLLFLTHDH